MATSIVETITPQKAQEYLAKSGGNRNISKGVVNSYATTMREGKWLLNGEPIVFDLNDVLLNGHHRLYAVIQSNTPIQTFVTRGVEHEAFTTFDCGRSRTLGQLIGMQGIKHYTSVASVVNVAFRLVNNLAISNTGLGADAKRTNSQMIDFFNRDRELFIEAGEFGTSMRNKAPFVDTSTIGGAYYFLIRYGAYKRDFVKDFFEDLCRMGTSKHKVVDILREKLQRNKMCSTKVTLKSVNAALIIKAWNFYVKGVVPKVLLFNPKKEDYPHFIKHNEL